MGCVCLYVLAFIVPEIPTFIRTDRRTRSDWLGYWSWSRLYKLYKVCL